MTHPEDTDNRSSRALLEPGHVESKYRVRFVFDDRSLVPLSELERCGYRFKELHFGNRIILIEDSAQAGTILSGCGRETTLRAGSRSTQDEPKP